MAKHRPDLPPIPPRVAGLHVDSRGYPVPWFVAWMDAEGKECAMGEGTPDFRVVGSGKRERAIRESRCWICGEILGVYKSFLIGPMCAVNRVTSEPPGHTLCAHFAAIACPFLSMPKAKRREHGLPAEQVNPGGISIPRNPGASCVWTTATFRVFPTPEQGGWLIRLGEPVQVDWFANGRRATRAEIEESVASGYPILREMAEKDGPKAVEELDHQVALAREHFPREKAHERNTTD